MDNGLVAAMVAIKEDCWAAAKGLAMVVNLTATRVVMMVLKWAEMMAVVGC